MGLYALLPRERFAGDRNRDRKPRTAATSRESRRRSNTPSTTLCAARAARVLSFKSLGALGARAPEHAESAPGARLNQGAHGGCEGGQQTLRQACSQAYPGSARCVQSFDDSLDSASRKTYRISLRSSSLWEPRHPSLKVLQRLRLRRRHRSLDRRPLLSSDSEFSGVG